MGGDGWEGSTQEDEGSAMQPRAWALQDGEQEEEQPPLEGWLVREELGMPWSKGVEDVQDSLPKRGVPETVMHSRDGGGTEGGDSGTEAQK